MIVMILLFIADTNVKISLSFLLKAPQQKVCKIVCLLPSTVMKQMYIEIGVQPFI